MHAQLEPLAPSINRTVPLEHVPLAPSQPTEADRAPVFFRGDWLTANIAAACLLLLLIMHLIEAGGGLLGR